MADAAVLAELRVRNGRTERISVPVTNQLSSLINGIHELSPKVSQLLSELVEQERPQTCVEGEEDDDSDDDDEDDEDEDPDEPPNSEPHPPAKRSKI